MNTYKHFYESLIGKVLIYCNSRRFKIIKAHKCAHKCNSCLCRHTLQLRELAPVKPEVSVQVNSDYYGICAIDREWKFEDLEG